MLTKPDPVPPARRSRPAGARVGGPFRSSRGLSLLEILVVVAVLAVVASIGFLDLRGLGNELENATDGLEGTLRQTRARSMATTSAYRLVVDSPTRLRAEWNRTCDAAGGWNADERFDLELENGVRLAGGHTTGEILTCFTSRGFSTLSKDVSLVDPDGATRTVRVFRGGSVERMGAS